MCESDAKHSPPSTGSRRRRLWELDHQCHCPVVGVCLPLEALRRLVGKVIRGKPVAADGYELHVGVVAECMQRNRLSEVLQDELDTRFSRELLRFRAAKTTPAVADLWHQAVAAGDVAGALWAALTHPRCDKALQDRVCRDMHMLQHQAGARVQVDLERFHAVLDENATLARELARVQERSTRLLAEKSAEIAQLQAQLLRARADALAKDSAAALAREDLAALKASIPGLDSQQRQHQRIQLLAQRQSELEGQNTALRQQLAAATRSLESLRAEPLQQRETPNAPATVHLNQQVVLCVGGRSGNVASYRDVVERVGGRFAHHDGGLEDAPSVLDASLAAADLVICQTGCISHNAYWKVKDFCKRTGKRCVFVENPSTSSLVRGLEQISVQDTDAIPVHNAASSRSDAL
ncbi:MAG: DUF2325 domain-containing protein [Burkholderiales bacterium]|nr:DUF2325 domain-containing protein [Burkholderiales bacterium]